MVSKDRRILVVDDDTETRVGIAELLREEGYTVEEAQNGAQALSAIQKVRPGLVLLDLMMPIMSGEELLQKLEDSPALADIPVVIISARANAVVHGYPVLSKPLTLDRLLQAAATYFSQGSGHSVPPDAKAQ